MTATDTHHSARSDRRETQRDATTRTVIMIVATVLFFLVGVGMAVATWGLQALALVALGAVPIVFVVLILITFGK